MVTSRFSWRARGLAGRRAERVRAAISASRVRPPVATTVPRPTPSTTKVPARSTSPTSGCDVTLSPVSIDSSTATPTARSTRRSALTRSPASSSTTSSTTSSSAPTSTTAPSRSTRARGGSSSARRDAARSARYSWTKAKTPLSTTTTAMATASCGIPPTSASPAATHRVKAKKWIIWRSSWRTGGSDRAAGMTLGPSRSRWARTCSPVRPRGPAGGPVSRPPVTTARGVREAAESVASMTSPPSAGASTVRADCRARMGPKPLSAPLVPTDDARERRVPRARVDHGRPGLAVAASGPRRAPSSVGTRALEEP